MKRPRAWLAPIGLWLCAQGCSGDMTEHLEAARAQQVTRVRTDRTYLRDELGRYVVVNGINVSGSVKTPFTGEDGWPPELVDFEALPFSYTGRTMPIEQADAWLSELRGLGFNAIRLLVVWEGIEPQERGVYDEEYLDYIEQLVDAAERNRIYVLLDMHQDIWSRHLFVRYNEDPVGSMAEAGYDVAPEDIGAMLGSLVPPYTNTVRGDGAPRWVVEACLPHKDLGSPHWGDPYILGQLDSEMLESVADLLGSLGAGGEGGGVPAWGAYVLSRLPEPFGVTETPMMLPFTFWGLSQALSPDLSYCAAAFMAGRDVMPDYEIDGENVQDYLQGAYAEAWAQVARRVAQHRNVIGYDVMNEPNGSFIPLTAAALVVQAGGADGLEPALTEMLGPEAGPAVAGLLSGLRLIPADASPATLRSWGLDRVDLAALLGTNYGFDHNYLEPFYGRVARAIQDEDPEAITWIEPSASAENLLGGVGSESQFQVNMRWPQGVSQLVFAPHFYPDIYPLPGFNVPPRDFSVEEVRYRDYTGRLSEVMSRASYSLGNVPVVFGEFGTYFNYGGIEASRDDGYVLSAHILDNYYESFEAMGIGRMVWCFSPDNDYEQGDWWNHEDFSVIDPEGAPRAELAFIRPFARALSGKPVAQRFYSDYHYFDPDKGEPLEAHEFFLEMESKETDAPTEVFVPAVQYPDGFYVWLSDGYAVYDDGDQILYYFPTEDEPGHHHTVLIRPPIDGGENRDFDYFFRGGEMVNGR